VIRSWTGAAGAVAMIALGTAAAGAHTTATGLAEITVEDRTITYRLTVVPSELPNEAGDILAQAAAGDPTSGERLAAAMREHVSIAVDGEPCRPGRIALEDARLSGARVIIDYRLRCADAPGRLELAEDWTSLFGAHYATIASIKAPQGSREFVLGEETRRITADFGQLIPGSLWAFIRLGIAHILTGYDHLLFLAALLVGTATLWRVLGIVTAFTLAHSITLSLAVLGFVRIPSAIVEPLIAASIGGVAVENMFGRYRLWRRFAVTFLFGLVHGLGFADTLTALALQGWRLVRALVGFNIGVEIGQAIAIGLALPVLFYLGRMAQAPVVYRFASIAVAAAGSYWFVERVFFE